MSQDSATYITSNGSISALGSTSEEVWTSYLKRASLINTEELEGSLALCSKLSPESEKILAEIAENPKYRKLDRSVLMAIYTARKAAGEFIQTLPENKNGLINIGSSRGATLIFENSYKQYLQKNTVPVLTSPTTTLGNVSSWVAEDLSSNSYALSTSVTCSTALQAICNSLAWLRSGMADWALAGATEAPLTGYTVAQMRALRIYADDKGLKFPCQPLAQNRESAAGMVLGEGAGLFLLEQLSPEKARERNATLIEAIGFSRETLESATSMSEEGDGLYSSMQMAINSLPEDSKIDAIIPHAAGTDLGDNAEFRAISKLFPNELPLIISNKWMIGHTLGAAGALSLEYALLVLKRQSFTEFPYPVLFDNRVNGAIKRIMINAAGFGGNATSLIIRTL